jgi:aryl-alcohol dehydrogenase-like predicted oxidoreductase
MDKRRLGRTNHQSTVVIFGGAALGGRTQDEANAAYDLALSAGVNHIDIAPSYGKAETLTGPWLENHRDKFFLGCKTLERSRAGAWAELQRSMQLLHTDRLDLYQLHALTRFEELDEALAPGGAIETLVEAREKGLTRWLGVTGHGLLVPSIFISALERFDFDTVLFPINPTLYANPDYRRDAERLLALCQEKNVGVQIIKSVAKGPWGDQKHTYDTWYEPYDLQEKIDQGVRFALSQPGVTGIPAAGDVRLLPMVFQAAERFTPMSQDEQEALIEQAKQLQPLFVADRALGLN